MTASFLLLCLPGKEVPADVEVGVVDGLVEPVVLVPEELGLELEVVEGLDPEPVAGVGVAGLDGEAVLAVGHEGGAVHGDVGLVAVGAEEDAAERVVLDQRAVEGGVLEDVVH